MPHSWVKQGVDEGPPDEDLVIAIPISRHEPLSNKDELLEFLHQDWTKTPLQQCGRLVEMSRHKETMI